VGFAGILLSFMLIAIFVTLAQRKDFLEDYHDINRNFTHNLAINYTETLLRENDFILGRAAAFFARNDELNRAVNVEPEKGLTTLMQLQNMMPSVSSISLADTEGHYLRAPEVLENEDSRAFDPKTRPWFIKQAEASTFSHYTSPYMDFSPTIRRLPFSNPSLPRKGNSRAAWPFISISPPWGSRCADGGPRTGEFFVVQRDGKVVLHSDPGALFKPFVSDELMDKMTSGEGQLYDPRSDTWYYYSFTNPDWFVIFRVDNATLVNLTRHETNLVIGGFSLAAIIIILFGLYLRHASRTVLMNIINAIKTGDVKRAPRLEAMLSKAIETNKQRELTYVRQATIDALTGCKNRRAFDSDIAALMNDHQPFALALVDIDNFKSINDTWGHLNGDIVLRNVAREGLQVLQPLEISLYRYGGEEFAVVFPAEHIDNARTLLETWRVNVERRTWREDGLTVTFSAGLGNGIWSRWISWW
jgi:diguanylate cyclase (GGDEF)-like protein